MAKNKRVRPDVGETVDSVIVHDMKNLAFRLSALLQNMEENYENPLFKKSMTDVLGDTIRKMNAIVKRFKEQQQHVIVKLKIDLNTILSELLQNIPPRVSRNLIVESELSPVPLIWGDPFFLHNAFHSIIENAVDAMPDGGVLKVRTRSMKQGKKQKVSVEISDSGIGMSQTFLDNKLFSPFVSTKEQGLGLGLYTSQQIFSLHHGKIEVVSALGEGTTFRVILPADSNGA
jgi:signal transduction histidine kinase